MGAYRTEIDGHKVKFQFNIKNLTDRRYFEYSDGWQLRLLRPAAHLHGLGEFPMVSGSLSC